jgi:Glycosyltransferase
MKILILGNSDVGLYRFRKELLQCLVEHNHKVYVSIPRGEYTDAIKKIGVKYISTEVDRRGLNPFKDLKLLTLYFKFIRRLRPDIVLTYTIKPNIYGGIVCRLSRSCYMANITGLGTVIENKGILSAILLRLYKIALKKSAQVFFQNKENKEYLNNKNIVRGGRLIPGSGVNLSENCYEEYPDDSRGIYFLFVGRIMKDKGIEELIKCAEYFYRKDSHAHFDIIGGYDDESYKKQIEFLQKKGIMTSYGEQKDVHSFMKSHHAVILPSYHEGLSNVLLEAAASGRPILTTKVPGCMETFDEGETGFGCEPRNAGALIQIVNKFMELSYEDKRQMGFKGREKVTQYFDRNLVIEAYMDEIENSYGGKRK